MNTLNVSNCANPLPYPIQKEWEVYYTYYVFEGRKLTYKGEGHGKKYMTEEAAKDAIRDLQRNYGNCVSTERVTLRRYKARKL